MENSHFGIRTWPDAFVKKCAPFLRAAEVLLVGPRALDLLRELLDQGLERAVQRLKINDRLALPYGRTTSVVATLHISGLWHVLNSQP
jgi:hypothetical protein